MKWGGLPRLRRIHLMATASRGIVQMLAGEANLDSGRGKGSPSELLDEGWICR